MFNLYNENNTNQEQEAVLRQIEEACGGPIAFKTFAFYLGNSAGRAGERGGLIYIVGDDLYFEDFEKTGGLSQFFRKKTAYEKLRFSIPVRSIDRIQVTTERSARRCIRRITSPADIKEPPFWLLWFSRKVYMIERAGGPAEFFDILDDAAFLAFLRGLDSGTGTEEEGY
jgi:hypothetical protein